MRIYYIFLIISAILFGIQFFVTKKYTQYRGDTLKNTLWLSLLAYITIAIFFFIKSIISKGGEVVIKYTNFTFLMALGASIVTLGCIIIDLKVLLVGNMSLFSIFMQLGSIILPTLVGLIFFKEELSVLRWIALILMILSLFLSFNKDKTKRSKKAIIYYIAIFFLNGLIGVFFSIHQHYPELTANYSLVNGTYNIDSDLFMFYYALCMISLSAVLYLFIILKNRYFSKKEESINKINLEKDTNNDYPLSNNNKIILILAILIIPIIYGICNGLGNYFIVYSTSPGRLMNALTYPIVNGGSILVSTIFGILLFKEKIKWNNIVQIVVILSSLIMFVFG